MITLVYVFQFKKSVVYIISISTLNKKCSTMSETCVDYCWQYQGTTVKVTTILPPHCCKGIMKSLLRLYFNNHFRLNSKQNGKM